MKIAENFDQFVERVSEAERTVLNSPAGQALTEELLKMKLAQNPNMMAEEWAQTKSEFMTYAADSRNTPSTIKIRSIAPILFPSWAVCFGFLCFLRAVWAAFSFTAIQTSRHAATPPKKHSTAVIGAVNSISAALL